MRVLILGGSGMVGHKLWQSSARRFDTFVTFRRPRESYFQSGLFDRARALTGVTVEDFDSVVNVVDSVRPQVVVNCIGIVKQSAAVNDPLASIPVNSLFPHRLARLCSSNGIRLIHMGTDCVFSGAKGNYVEEDVSDAEDLYGRTKFLGEVSGEGCLTLRTSAIGRELEASRSLLEWFLSQDGKAVQGYKRAIFNGFTTMALSEIIVRIIAEHSDLHGVCHVASKPISKFDLLELIREAYGLRIGIEPDESVVCDRSLDGRRFQRATGLVAPTWPDMVEEMYKDATPYPELRRRNAKEDSE
jgi:dTDP-4-dehydrorhamnose reductase